MNFKGRYWTTNETLVGVHPTEDPTSEGVKFWGHEIRLQTPFKDDRKFYWNGDGKCLKVIGTVDATGKFDLVRAANPMTYASQIEVVDCEECRKERASKLNTKLG